MKKIILFVGLCCLVLIAPITIGASIQKTIPSKQIIPSNHAVAPCAEPPAWAKGNFSGFWGITVLGVPLAPIGWITGYYQNIGFGKLEALYADFNQTNATSSLGGFMLWIFFFGGATNLQTGNATWVSGIGIANQTSFYWRINALIGPSFYIRCNYTAFGNSTSSFHPKGTIRYTNEQYAHVLDT